MQTREGMNYAGDILGKTGNMVLLYCELVAIKVTDVCDSRLFTNWTVRGSQRGAIESDVSDRLDDLHKLINLCFTLYHLILIK